MTSKDEEHHHSAFGDLKAISNAVLKQGTRTLHQGTRALQKGTRVVTKAGKVMGSVVVGAADAVHLTTAINLTSQKVAIFGKKAGITTGVQRIRRQFFRDYVGMDIPELDAEEDLADADDGIILNDDELEVEERFFEKGFDAVGWEVNFLVHLGEDEDLQVIRGHLEVHELKRRRQHDLVGMTLKKRVLLRHSEFVDAINEVMGVLHNLHATAEACVAARMRLKEAKHSCAVRGLRVPMLDRRKRRLQQMAAITEAMKQFIARYHRVTRHLENNEYSEAVQIMQETTEEHLPPKLLELRAMDTVIRKWKELHSPDTLIRYVHRYIDSCLSNFDPSKYVDVMEGVRKSYNYMLGELTRQRMGEKIRDRLMGIMKSSIAKVSSEKDTDLPIDRLASKIEASALTLCMSSMCIHLVGCLRLFGVVIKAHEDVIDAYKLAREIDPSLPEEDSSQQNSTIAFHTKCIRDLKLALRDFDLPQNLGYIITYAPLHSIDKSNRYHAIQLARMLVEALVPFLVGLPEKQQIYHQRRDCTSPNGNPQQEFYISKETLFGPINTAALGIMRRVDMVLSAADLMQATLNDSWSPGSEEKSAILRGAVVKPMDTRLFDEQARLVTAFVNPDVNGENPFYQYQHPVNTSDYFGDVNGPAISPRGGKQQQTIYFNMSQFQETRFCNPHRMVFTSSSVRFYGLMTSMLFDVVARVPTIADGALKLFETLVTSYMVMATDMLVRKHKGHQLVEDTRFTAQARALFKSVMVNDNVFAAFTSDKTFPPKIFNESRWINGFADEKKLFAVEDRLTVFESVASVVSLYECFIDSVAGLMSKEAQIRHLERAAQLKSTANELLEVGCHMISTAIIQGTLTNLLTNLNGAKFDHSGSSFIKKFIDSYKRDDGPRLTKAMSKAPTKYSQDIFWSRLYFTVLDTMAKALAPNRQRLNEKNIINCVADVSSLQEQLKAHIPSTAVIVFDKYVLQFLNTYFLDEEQGWEWLCSNHTYYHAEDLCKWFGNPSPESQSFLIMEKRLFDQFGRRRTEDAQLLLVSPSNAVDVNKPGNLSTR